LKGEETMKRITQKEWQAMITSETAVKKIIDKLKCCDNCDYNYPETLEDYVRCVNCSSKGKKLPNWTNKAIEELINETKI
jgi:ribosomal protein S26